MIVRPPENMWILIQTATGSAPVHSPLFPLEVLASLAFDRYLVLYLSLLLWWGSSWSSTQFIRFCRRKHSTLPEKWGLNCPAGKAELPLNWCGYTAGSTWRAWHNAHSITMDGSLMGELMCLLINIWSKLHHVLLMRLQFSSGVCFPAIGKISQACTYVWCTEKRYTRWPTHAVDYVLCFAHAHAGKYACALLVFSFLFIMKPSNISWINQSGCLTSLSTYSAFKY